MRFLRITRADLPRWQKELAALEQTSRYPLGDDWFRIDHGDNYFAFFERMGEPYYYAFEDGGRLVAVVCGVRRERCWYACDAKVHTDYRGRHLIIAMARRAFFQNYLRCGRGYLVAMNPADGRTPPGVRLIRHFPFIPSSLLDTLQLDIYSADADRMRDAMEIFARAIHFVSLRGIKDLILESTGAPLPLLHVSFGARRDAHTFDAPQPDHTHMWCVPRKAGLTSTLAAAGFLPSASATVMFHRMPRFDGSMIETSEI